MFYLGTMVILVMVVKQPIRELTIWLKNYFQDFNEINCFGCGRAFCGEIYGWHFNEFYQPVIRISQQDIRYNVVSNT